MNEEEFWVMAYIVALHKTGFNHDAKEIANRAVADYKEHKDVDSDKKSG